MQVEDQASRAIYARLRHRARSARALALGFVALIALTLAFGSITYFLAGDVAVGEARAVLEIWRAETEQHTQRVEKRDRTATELASPGGGAGSAEPAASAPSADAAPPVGQARPRAATTSGAVQIPGMAVGDAAFAAAVIRITAVVLMIALVFVFAGLYRYSMRLASYYDEKADALRLLEAGDRHLEERLSQITVPGTAGTGAPARRREPIAAR